MEVTEPRPQLFSNRALVGLMIPIILDALLSIIAGMVDSAMVSSAGEAAVSAVSLVDSINILFISMFASIAVGGSVVTTQYVGSRNYKQGCISANQLFYAGLTISTVLMLVLLALKEPILHKVYGHIEADVLENALTYFSITLIGYPFSAVGNASTAILRSMGKNRQAVTTTIAFNVINVIGNATLIYGFHLGVAGAAISTTFSRMVFAVWSVSLAHSKKLPVHFSKLLHIRLDFDIMRRVLRIGLTNGMESSMFHIGKILISSLVSSFGTIFIAANSVSFTINNIGWTIVGSMGTVLLTVVGQCIGAGEPDQAKRYTKKLLTVATVFLFVMFSFVFLMRHHLVRLFDFSQEALEVSAYYTGVYALLSMVALYSFSFVPMSAFRAAGDIRYAVTLSIFSMFAFRVASCYVLNALFPSLGLMCVCLGMALDWAFRAVCNIRRYRSGKWLHKKLI